MHSGGQGMAAMRVLRWMGAGLLCSLLLAGPGALSAAPQDGLLESLLLRLPGVHERVQTELQVMDVAVAFDVINVNRSGVPCFADGAHIAAPSLRRYSPGTFRRT